MRKTAILPILSLVATAALIATPAFAQYCDLSGSPITTLRDPLIWGATSTAPFTAAPQGQPPPMGQGTVPPPVNPGMSLLGPPTLIPTVPITPANDIENPSYRIDWDPANESAPGEVGPSISVPPPPSTPGDDPGILHAPLDFVPPPARVVNINPGGGIPGPIPDQRWGGQQSHDYGLYRHRGTKKYDWAQEEQGSETFDGGTHARNDAKDTQDLYGSRWPLKQGAQMSELAAGNNPNSQGNQVTNAMLGSDGTNSVNSPNFNFINSFSQPDTSGSNMP